MRKTDEDTHQLFQDNAAPRLSNSRFDVALPSYEIRRDNGIVIVNRSNVVCNYSLE